MKKINGGATIWARQTIQSDVFYWKPDKWFKIWFYIVNKVNHKDNKLFKRGTNFITYKEIEVATKATHSQVDKFIRWSKQTTMLTTRKTTRGMIVKVLNYALFQDFKNYTDDTEKDTLDETQTIRRRFKDDTINKNDNNDNNDKKNPKGLAKPVYGNPLINKFLEYLKEKAEVIDTPVKSQRTDSWILIRKMKSLAKEKVGKEPTDDEVWNGLQFLIDTACNDKFHRQRVGKIRYLYENIGVITKSKQTKKWTII